jgi:mannose-6-phosphate isomerase-like protein (cupin superfamily)
VDSADLRDYVEFSEEGPVRKTVFESEHLFTQVVCVDVNGSYGPVSDPSADAVVTVVAGEAAFQVGRSRKRLEQWGSLLVPARTELHVANASPEPLVLLVVTAPPPVPREVSG